MEQKQQTINDNESGGRATRITTPQVNEPSWWQKVINWLKKLLRL